jgi:hypothetical protein
VLLLLTTLAILGGLFMVGVYFINRAPVGDILINLPYSFLEVSLLIAVSVLFGLFTAPLNAALYTLAIFIIGHALVGLHEFVASMGSPVLQRISDFSYYLLPNLSKFDVRQALLYDVHIPASQVAWTLAYWVLYVGLALGLAIQVMKKREV